MQSNINNATALISFINSALPEVELVADKIFSWQPKRQAILYDDSQISTPTGQIELLHEVGHAALGHRSYDYDAELVSMESDAWHKAKLFCDNLNLAFDDYLMQDDLDTYRDWLHKRSTCVSCGFTSLQVKPLIYRCFNCESEWAVPHSPICRRKLIAQTLVAKP